jgi:hypothetical protein
MFCVVGCGRAMARVAVEGLTGIVAGAHLRKADSARTVEPRLDRPCLRFIYTHNLALVGP